MQHLAIDLGSKESHICVRGPDGSVLLERKVGTRSLGSFLRGQPKSRVVLETCSEAFRIADMAIDLDHEVRVVPATLVRSLGVGTRGIKTDRRDALVLSEASCRIDLPSVHIPSDVSRHRKMLCGTREELVRCRTALINNVRGWTRTQLIKVRTGDVTTFGKRVREATEKHPDGLPQALERALAIVEAINEQIAEAEKELELTAQDDPTCQLLMTVPGVGPITSIRFVSAIDELARFPSAQSVQSYLGLTPGENSSSDRKQRTSITKAGPPAVRRALIQAAWNLRRLRPGDPICRWALQIEQRRGKFIATVAVARKLAGILFAMWRDGTSYRPSLTGQT